jgi:hypothetical protein
MRSAVTLLALAFVFLPPASAQTPADVMKKAITAFTMLESEDGTVAAGLVVGSDADSLYIAGAAHMLTTCTGPLPSIKVSFDGIATSKTGTVKQCDSTAGIDALLLTVGRDAETNAFLLRYDPELLTSNVPPPESPVYSIGYSSFTPWFQGKGETMRRKGRRCAFGPTRRKVNQAAASSMIHGSWLAPRCASRTGPAFSLPARFRNWSTYLPTNGPFQLH